MNRRGILDDIDQKILKLRGRVPTRDMADILGIPEGTTLKRVQQLIRTGYLAVYSSSTQPRAGKRPMTPRRCLCCGVTFNAVEPGSIRRMCQPCRQSA